METKRGLLVAGNEKLSAQAFHFDLPAGRTCPGRSRLCHGRCYARRGRYAFPQVQERLNWCFEQSKRDDFVGKMTDELYRKGVLLMRWHCAGDVYSPAYARKMLEVMEKSEHTSFWLYSRSWRVATICPILKDMAALNNCKLWFSVDAETGYPEEVPENVRVAWLQTEDGEDLEDADLVFLDLPLRKRPIPLTVLEKVCPAEIPEGKKKGVTCATCRYCWVD